MFFRPFQCVLLFRLALSLALLVSFSAFSSAHAQKPTSSSPSFLVCIDPGHPSETARGAFHNGLSENRINWQVALRLEKQLQALGIASVMTKSSENQMVTNKQRAEIANGKNRYRRAADAFVRLHCDAGGGRGWTFFYPDRAARKAGGYGPPKDVQIKSRQLAHVMNEAMKPVLRGSLQSNPIKTDAQTGVGGKQGGVLTGSIFAKVPTVLVEMVFLNQKNDARFIASAAGQEKMARALAAGLVAWKNQRR